MVVFEGYTGPGVFSKREDGSPVILLGNLVQRLELLSGDPAVRFVIGDNREDRFEKLTDVTGQRFPHLPAGIGMGTAMDRARTYGSPLSTRPVPGACRADLWRRGAGHIS